MTGVAANGVFGKPRFDDPAKEVEYLRKLIFLAANNIIFFSRYDEEADLELAEQRALVVGTPQIDCGDTFYYACADCEQFNEQDVDIIIEAYSRFGSDALTAWISIQRDNLKPLRLSSSFCQARDWLRDEKGVVKREYKWLKEMREKERAAENATKLVAAP